MSTIVSHLPLNILQTDISLIPKDHQEEMAYGVSNGHVTEDVMWPPKGQTCDSNTLRAQYLENSWGCYL